MEGLSLCQSWIFLKTFFDRVAQKYYYAPPMPAQTVIDSLEFARIGQELRGSLAVPGMKRLLECLAEAPGEVEFMVKGGHDPRRRPTLSVDISGTLRLQCQRCLGALDYPLRLSNTLRLVSAGETAAGDLDEEDAEWIEASAELDVAALVEDEILLSLPYAPRHEEGQCGQGLTATKAGAGFSAFAKLAALKQKNN